MHILRRFHIRGTSFPPPGVATALWAVVCLLALAACRSPAGSETDPCGPGLIIPGVCIDGVRLGDSREEVEKLLGEPSSVSLGDGARSWIIYEYQRGLVIFFIEQPIEPANEWGPVDVLSVHEPYRGNTPSGIGIDSSLEQVKEAYGEPDNLRETELSNGRKLANYIYCNENKIHTTIEIENNIVTSFSIGHFIPIEQSNSLCS